MNITRFGELSSTKDKTTGGSIINDDLARDRLLTFSSNNKEDSFEIHIHGLKDINDDHRKSFIRIIHIIAQNIRHELKIVMDFTQHTYKRNRELHLNFTDKSRNVIDRCDKCKHYFNNFDHKVIIPSIATTNGGAVKIVDTDSVWGQMRAGLVSASFFQHYEVQNSKSLLFK